MAESVLDDGNNGCRGTDVVFVYFKRNAPCGPAASDKPRENSESLLNRFFLSRVVITTLSVSVILTFVNTSPVLLMEIMGFERGEYATIMALTAGVSMTVSFSTPFALGILSHVR